MKNQFLDTPQCVKSFYDRTEQEFSIHDIGYHNFRFVKSFPFYRTQKMYTIHFVLSGKGYLKFHHKTYNLKKFDVFVLPPEQLFCYYADEKDPWEYVFFDFNGSKASEYVQSLDPETDSPIRTCSSPNKIYNLFSEFFEKYKNGAPVSYFEISALLFSLLDSLLTLNDNNLSYRENLIEEAKGLIGLKFFEADLSVKAIADDLHVSHSHLSRKFKKETGVTMISYITDLRVKYAEVLLQTTDLSATQIAYMSGFNEYTYFLMTFKRKNNMTTTEYREMLIRNKARPPRI